MPKAKKRADGRYQVQVYLGRDPNGKRLYKYFYGSTQKEVATQAQAYRDALGKGLDPSRQDETFGDLLSALTTKKRAQGLGQKTLEGYAAVQKHYAALALRPAADLRSADFQSALNALADWHDGRPPLSHRTLTLLYTTAKAAYALAIPEVLSYNPLDRVVIPAGVPAKQRLPIPPQQQAWVREMPHRAQRAAMLLLYSGLRRGEASALTWADVDLSSRTITVNKSLDFATGQIKAPKTAAGVRTVNIPQLLADYLATQQDGCLYVLHTPTGQRLTATIWKQMWRSYMQDLNVRYGYDDTANKFTPGGLPMRIQTFTPHQLRHTFCTLLYFAGVDVLTARDQMGHSNISVTLSIYTHLDKQYKQDSMSKLDSFLLENNSSKTSV